MEKKSTIYVAGHRGLVGSAIVRALERAGYTNLLVRTRQELDLTDQAAVRAFFTQQSPEYVFLAAARVGGILANSSRPAEFIQENLAIQTNVIHSSFCSGVKRLLFLGSSCIYPKMAPQPIRESSLLTGPLESTNRPYALAKIAGIEMCWAYNRQYGTRYLAAMPTNLYGPGDNYDLETSHVIPALLRKIVQAKETKASSVSIWGTGTAKREFLHSDDLADGLLFLMNLSQADFARLADSDVDPPIVNVGFGKDLSIRELAEIIAEVVGFHGTFVFDSSKPDGTPKKQLDISKLGALGWFPKIELRAGLARTYREYLETNM